MVDAPEARVRRLFFAVMGVLALVTLVPIWSARFLPLLELPAELDALAIWHRFHDASWGYSKLYDLGSLPLPYWGYFVPVDLLSYVLPLEIANKVYLSVYAVLLPISVAALAKRMGRSRWLALFSFPLVFNVSFGYGFIAFCMALALLDFAVVALDSFLAAPTAKRAAALCLLSLALSKTHLLLWLFFCVASLVLIACHGFHPRRVAAALALELPSLLLGIIGLGSAGGGHQFVGERLLTRLQQMPVRLVSGWGNDQAYWLLLILASAWLLLLMTARNHTGDNDTHQDRTQPIGFHYRLELLLLTALIFYLVLPMGLQRPVDVWMINGRFLVVAALFGALLPVGEIAGARRWILIPVLAIALAYPIVTTIHYVRYDQHAASFRRLMQSVPRGSSTLVLITNDSDPDLDAGTPFTNYHAYAQYLGGGFDPWAPPSGFPLSPKAGSALPAPRWRHAKEFNFESHGRGYDYIVTKGEAHDYDAFGPDDAPSAPVVGADGDFRLYRVQKSASQP